MQHGPVTTRSVVSDPSPSTETDMLSLRDQQFQKQNYSNATRYCHHEISSSRNKIIGTQQATVTTRSVVSDPCPSTETDMLSLRDQQFQNQNFWNATRYCHYEISSFRPMSVYRDGYAITARSAVPETKLLESNRLLSLRDQ